METILPLFGSFLIAIIALFVAKKTKKEPTEKGPPKNTAADASRDNIQQTFEEEVGEIKKDTEGEDPAGALADRGNARSR